MGFIFIQVSNWPRTNADLHDRANELIIQIEQGHAVTVPPQNTKLTTEEVADDLNVSRPYGVKLIEEERLPARKVGTRRRVALADLQRFDEQQRTRQRAALDELARIDAELGL
jgi:excisionase family DNA binding protein